MTVIVFAQRPTQVPLSFEVASIRPAQPIARGEILSGSLGLRIDGSMAVFRDVGVGFLVFTAYRAKPYQISHPDWTNAPMYDIRAKLPNGASQEQLPEMLQALLAERFKLSVHRDIQEQSVYALVVGKGGAKLQKASRDTDSGQKEGVDARRIASTDGSTIVSKLGKYIVTTGLPDGSERRLSKNPDGSHHLTLTAITLAGVADALRAYVDRPVIDATEIKGDYQVELDISEQDIRNGSGGTVIWPGKDPGDSDAGGLGISSSLNKLGLRLERRKAPVEIIVVDHVNWVPTEN